MRRVLAVLSLILVAGFPGRVSAGNLELHAGGYFPRADTRAGNDLFRDDSSLYNVSKKDWNGWTGGVAFNAKIARNLELGFSVDGHNRTIQSSYRGYTRDNGREISQTLEFNMVPVGVSLRFIPTGHPGHIAPYLAVGADIIFYEYRERGDFIDFGQASRPVIPDSFRSQGATPGFHVAGGVRIPLNHDFSIVAEGRYQWAKADMADDFRDNKLDLTGASATVGVNLRF